jgi:hypothetical protein
VNTAKREAREVFGGRGAAPLRWQDKKGELRLSAASGQPLWLPKTALNTQSHTKSPHNTVHSTKRKTVFAGSWIDGGANAVVLLGGLHSPTTRRRSPTGSDVSQVIPHEGICRLRDAGRDGLSVGAGDLLSKRKHPL